MTKTRADIIHNRSEIIKMSQRKSVFNRGDRRVHTPRICTICSRPLVSLVIRENKYITTIRHTRVHINKMFIVDMCTDIKSCYRFLESRKGSDINADDE